MQSHIARLCGEVIDFVEHQPRRLGIEQHHLCHRRPRRHGDGLSARGAVRLAVEFTEPQRVGLADHERVGWQPVEVGERHRGHVLLALDGEAELFGPVERREVQRACGSRRHEEADQTDPLGGGLRRLDTEHHRPAAGQCRGDGVEQAEQCGQPPGRRVERERHDALPGDHAARFRSSRPEARRPTPPARRGTATAATATTRWGAGDAGRVRGRAPRGRTRCRACRCCPDRRARCASRRRCRGRRAGTPAAAARRRAAGWSGRPAAAAPG